MPNRLNVFLSQNEPAGGLVVQVFDNDGRVTPLTTIGHSVNLEPLTSKAIVMSATAGYWSKLVVPTRPITRVDLMPIEATGPLGWWHFTVGIITPDIQRGTGIRIGVIDRTLEKHPHDASIAHVKVVGDGNMLDPWVLDNGFLPRNYHGNAVVSLIASRTADDRGFQGIAPGAEVCFVSAKAPPAAEGISGGGLSAARVANAIRKLAREYDCDVISISAGDYEDAVPVIEDALLDAQEEGVLCFLAAGNKGGEALYPARYSAALAVAALTMKGSVPDGTAESINENPDAAPGDVSRWRASASGWSVDFEAPGTNVVWDHAGGIGRAVTGTSFAAPIAAATASLVLMTDRDRWANLPKGTSRWEEKLTLVKEFASNSDGEDFDPGFTSEYGIIRMP